MILRARPPGPVAALLLATMPALAEDGPQVTVAWLDDATLCESGALPMNLTLGEARNSMERVTLGTSEAEELPRMRVRKGRHVIDLPMGTRGAASAAPFGEDGLSVRGTLTVCVGPASHALMSGEFFVTGETEDQALSHTITLDDLLAHRRESPRQFPIRIVRRQLTDGAGQLFGEAPLSAYYAVEGLSVSVSARDVPVRTRGKGLGQPDLDLLLALYAEFTTPGPIAPPPGG